MIEKLSAFVERHDSFILTTHDPADADGIGAQMILARIFRDRGKQVRVVNAGPVPENLRFMDGSGLIEQLDGDRHGALPERSALVIADTADENHIGQMKEVVGRAREVFVVDHHEPRHGAALPGVYDATAASTCEMALELAKAAGIAVDPETAFAAYVGIVCDTGFFAFPKVGARTFAAARELVELGANPNEAYRRLCENVSVQALLLQQKALAGLSLHCGNRVALQVLGREDFDATGALSGDTDGFVNFPLRTREVVVSFMVKETPEGKVCCSLRSKGAVNVAKIARELGGGGHLNASGFKSSMGLYETVAGTLAKITEHLEAL